MVDKTGYTTKVEYDNYWKSTYTKFFAIAGIVIIVLGIIIGRFVYREYHKRERIGEASTEESVEKSVVDYFHDNYQTSVEATVVDKQPIEVPTFWLDGPACYVKVHGAYKYTVEVCDTDRLHRWTVFYSDPYHYPNYATDNDVVVDAEIKVIDGDFTDIINAAYQKATTEPEEAIEEETMKEVSRYE